MLSVPIKAYPTERRDTENEIKTKKTKTKIYVKTEMNNSTRQHMSWFSYLYILLII